MVLSWDIEVRRVISVSSTLPRECVTSLHKTRLGPNKTEQYQSVLIASLIACFE